MKKLLFIMLCFLCITGCYRPLRNMKKASIFNKSFGSYEVSKNWVESKEHSTASKFFYVLKGHEQDLRPNNISIHCGTNKYGKEEHDAFKVAILNQLSMQMEGRDDVKLNATGSNTEAGDVVYIFIIEEMDSDIITTQYYIVGDYKYILVQETIFDESKDVDNVAKGIVNSFKWK